jgi:hypothetical protein
VRLPDGVLAHEGTALECEWDDDNEDLLRERRLDDRFPFYYWELSYRKGRKNGGGRIWVPQGAALGAKLATLHYVVGPWRLRSGRSFAVPAGGGYDPVWDSNGKRVTHRKSSTSQHQYRPEVWSDHPTRARGTAWDVRPRGDDQPNEDDLSWLKSLSTPDGRKVSLGVYYPGRGNFVHVDLRPGAPWRQRMKPPRRTVA